LYGALDEVWLACITIGGALTWEEAAWRNLCEGAAAVKGCVLAWMETDDDDKECVAGDQRKTIVDEVRNDPNDKKVDCSVLPIELPRGTNCNSFVHGWITPNWIAGRLVFPVEFAFEQLVADELVERKACTSNFLMGGLATVGLLSVKGGLWLAPHGGWIANDDI
jgi:hypothetical protein